ncbi:MAG: oxidoreductase, partial [Myxococcales bacterium]|nr:oxidoreductase [Myxococcales bacterium]
ESGCRVYTVLQLRVHPQLIKLRERLLAERSGTKHDVSLTYVTRRGRWYFHSWKGDVGKSGGIVLNIGVHFFDLLMWLFGGVEASELHTLTPARAAGAIELEHARVRWLLSVDGADLPESTVASGQRAFRSITIDGQALEFSDVFRDLHTAVYRDILDGGGFGIADARPSIELTYGIRTSTPASSPRLPVHPLATR